MSRTKGLKKSSPVKNTERLIFWSIDGVERAIQPVGIMGAVLGVLEDVDREHALGHAELHLQALAWLNAREPGASSAVDDESWSAALNSLRSLIPRVHLEDDLAYLDGGYREIFQDLKG